MIELSRSKALALAGVLAATVLTGGAAILGIAHIPTHAQPAQVTLVQAPTGAAQSGEEAD